MSVSCNWKIKMIKPKKVKVKIGLQKKNEINAVKQNGMGELHMDL